MSEKRCNKCGDVLVVGENCTQYRIDHSQYRCRECAAAWQVERNHSRGISSSMAENRDCSLFIGVHVAERILSMVFKDVVRMPNGNPGYDIKCNRGKLVDVKSACMTKPVGSLGTWTFNIKRNKIAEYFLLLAFSNRSAIDPLHCWLIPGENVNNVYMTSISMSTIHKWDDYKIDIGKVVACCDEMKNGCI